MACKTKIATSYKQTAYLFNAGVISAEEWEKFVCAWWRTSPRFSSGLVPPCGHCGAEGFWNG